MNNGLTSKVFFAARRTEMTARCSAACLDQSINETPTSASFSCESVQNSIKCACFTLNCSQCAHKANKQAVSSVYYK